MSKKRKKEKTNGTVKVGDVVRLRSDAGNHALFTITRYNDHGNLFIILRVNAKGEFNEMEVSAQALVKVFDEQ